MPTPEKLAGSLVLRRYRLDDVLSSGGMGVLYRATHLRTGRRVALKFLLERGDSARFTLEARAAAELKHPNVVDVIDMDEDENGVACLVLELLEGKSLAHVLDEQGRLSAEQCANWLLPVMGALAIAHERGILHRDLKPANLFIASGPNDTTVPKLLDFGIAKLDSQPSLTSTGAILGTPSYMSPEQARGDRDLLAASDVWAMGVLWFRCLTGRLPFEHATAMGTLMRIVNERAPRVETIHREVPRAIGWAVDRALQHDPSARYADMRTFARALLAAGLQDGLALPVAPDPRGLPDWSSWLSEDRNLSNTATMLAPVPAQAQLSLPALVAAAATTRSKVAEAKVQAALPAPALARPPASRPRYEAGVLLAVVIAALIALVYTRWPRTDPSSSAPARMGVNGQPAGSPRAQPAAAPAPASEDRPYHPAAASPRGVSRTLQEDEF